MLHIFSEDERKLLRFPIEDIWFTPEKLEGSGRKYLLTGTAEVDGEIYHGFEIEFETKAAPEPESADEVMSLDWDSYDFKF